MLTTAQLLAIFPTAIDAGTWASAHDAAWKRFGMAIICSFFVEHYVAELMAGSVKG